MKKTFSIEKVGDKVVVTYFNGEHSEYFLMAGKIPDDMPGAADVLFKSLADFMEIKILQSLDEFKEILTKEMGIPSKQLWIP